MPTVLFYRDFRRFTGGDLKVWDYFNHVRATPGWDPYVRFSPESVWNATNPWTSAREHVLEPGAALEPDVHFVSGVDWRQIDGAVRADSPRPVINLVQHVKHADPDDSLLRHRFLPHKAIRICVSSQVAQAIEATGTVRGPVFTVPDGIDVAPLEQLGDATPADLDVVVAANKQPEMGAAVAARLEHPGRTVELLDTRIPRPELLGRLARARVAVLVPNPEEGFYLPAVETMALGTLLVCPDCVGNRSYARAGVNCFMPRYEVEAIAAQAEEALAAGPAREPMIAAARATARRHDLAEERAAFQSILGRVDELWDS
jgi:hypothetical protein